MKAIANLFLILFPLAAVLAIGSALLSPFWPANPLTSLSELADFSCLVFGLFIYLALGFNQHLPKRLFVPLLATLLWSLLDFWPLELWAGEQTRLLTASGQLLLCLLLLKFNRARNRQSRLLVDSQFVGASFSGGNLLLFCLVNLLLLPILLPLLLYAGASSLIREQTAGFVRLKPDGLYMIERTYQQQGKSIRLTGMIHLGQESYYHDLLNSLADKELLVLAEGVSDKAGLLRENFSYRQIAELLGLSAQEKMPFHGRLVSADSLQKLTDIKPGRADILRADIDISEFDRHTIAVLNALAKYLLNSESLVTGYQQFNRWAAENIHADSQQIIMYDLVEKRNAAVLGYLPAALKKYDSLVIPWGALHMPGLEAAVKERGFVLQQSRERRSIDFRQLPYKRLWQNLLAAGREQANAKISLPLVSLRPPDLARKN